ncbi:serine/threonine-rich domain-containing protein [Schistosoma japonicum]|uniref:Serine/threonine-rich domain-containing protein n=1 Tax=Schistosoma japonicum TaxID=6182 RepID=A0A4Z2DRS2_SCHJA|nr:serine/threonine-rich domain-containing protein [Schistosoma japonicum]TNN19096.1 serine/threonine-rich domain-containing protein [Schistosoma japonicum]TNN19097.1 serine/threonine-rich domain-containing protein [Schistosoma japonicum]
MSNYRWKLKSSKDSLGLRLISSLDFDRDPEAKFSKTPHLVYTYESKNEMKTHLLLGDVLRIVYLLLRNCKNQLVLRNVLKHCRHFCRQMPSGDIHLCTPTGFSSLGPIYLPNYSCTILNSTLLFIVHWSSDNILKEILSVAYNSLPSHETWYSCCTKMSLHSLSLLILKPKASKRISNFAKALSIRPGQMSNATSWLSTLQTNESNSTDNLPFINPYSSYQDWELYKELFDCLPKSLTTILKMNIGLPVHHIAALGLLINSFHNTCIYLFTDTRSIPQYNLNVQLDERLPVNLFNTMQNLHQAVSICLSRLRDSYPSLMSAGACLRARYELLKINGDNIQQQPYLRIARGRARLFESESVARDNISRIFSEEVNPHILNLINLLELIHHNLCHLTANIFLLGPFYNRNISLYNRNSTLINSKQWVIESLTYMKKLVHLANRLSKLNSSLFVETSFRLLEYLTTDVTRYLHSLRDKVLFFKHQLSQSHAFIINTWIPAYKGMSTEVNSRADIDLRHFFSSLQSQYDVIESWTRCQYDRELRHIGGEMINLLTTLSKCWKCQFLYRNLKLPCLVLSVPYGSRNNSSHSLLKEHNVIPLSPWPPNHPSFVLTQHLVQTNLHEYTNQSTCPSSSHSQEFVYSKLTFSQGTLTRMSKSNLNIELSPMVNSNNSNHKDDACSSFANNFSHETLLNDQLNDTSDINVKSTASHIVNHPSSCTDVIGNSSEFSALDVYSHQSTEKLSTIKNLPGQSTLIYNSILLKANIKEISDDKSSSSVSPSATLLNTNRKFEIDSIDVDAKSPREVEHIKSCVRSSYELDNNHFNSIIISNESKKDSYSGDTKYYKSHDKANINQDNQISNSTLPPNNDIFVHTHVQASFTSTSENVVENITQIDNEYSEQSSVVINQSAASPVIANTVISNCLPLLNSPPETCEEHTTTHPPISNTNITRNNTSSASINDDSIQYPQCNKSQSAQEIFDDSDSLLNENVSASSLQRVSFYLPTSSNSFELSSMDAETTCDHHEMHSNHKDAPKKSQEYSCSEDENMTNNDSNSNNNDNVSDLLELPNICICEKQPKGKSVKKVCIYLPNSATTNSSVKDIVSQCNNEEIHTDSDELDSCIMSLDRRRAGKLKRKLKEFNRSTFSKRISTNPSNMSDTSETVRSNSNNETSKDIQIMDSLYYMPITSDSPTLEETPHTSCSLTNTNEIRPVNSIETLAPWLKEKSVHPLAPGPVTAAILGQPLPLLSSDISIDLTVDD